MLKGKPGWDSNLLEKVRRHIALNRYRFTRHTLDRLKQRSFELHDVIYVLSSGFHEEEKTLFNTQSQSWNYAIRGKTLDGTDARVIVAFEKDMIIITAIRLTKRKK